MRPERIEMYGSCYIAASAWPLCMAVCTEFMRLGLQLLQVLPPELAADVIALHPSRHTQQVRRYVAACTASLGVPV